MTWRIIALVRWQPDAARCEECGFEWSCDVDSAVRAVEASLLRLPPRVDRDQWTRSPQDGAWSPAQYLWHLVDVLRIGTERLWVVEIDPGAGLVCWDENALASARQYQRLSPRVAAIAVDNAIRTWVAVARRVPSHLEVAHDASWTMTAADIIRRSAHEVHHHWLDIDRGLAQGPEP
jgi:DinB superfamily